MGKTIAIDINDTLRDYTGQFIKIYNKVIDPSFDIDEDDVTSFDFSEVFPFHSRDDYNAFKYEDAPYEIYARAEPMERMLPYRLNDWIYITLRDVDEDKVPNVIMVSPFEANLTIQATLVFLSNNIARVREFYFPMDSATIWDRCDILITANPNLIANVPEGKTVIKINAPYNKEAEAKYVFDSLMDVIQDPDETVLKLIEGDDDADA